MASGFTQYFAKWRAPSLAFVKDLLQFVRDPVGRMGYSIAENILLKDHMNLRDHLSKGGWSAVHHIDKLSCLMQRPRILKFADMDFGILENIEVRIPANQYEQPFSTTVIELPESYRKEHTVNDPFFNGPVPGGSVNEKRTEQMWPMFVCSTWRPHLQMLSVHIFLSSSDVFGCVLGGDTHNLEEQLLGADDTFIRSLKVTEEEKESYRKIMRACLNANLFATGVELSMSPENPTYFEKLKRHKDATGSEDWKLYKRHPFIYTPLKSVASEAGECVVKSNGGWTLSPHWRRPHWRMQRYGPGLSQEKKILIKGVFVNAEKL